MIRSNRSPSSRKSLANIFQVTLINLLYRSSEKCLHTLKLKTVVCHEVYLVITYYLLSIKMIYDARVRGKRGRGRPRLTFEKIVSIDDTRGRSRRQKHENPRRPV